MILGIETATSRLSVALVNDGDVLFSVNISARNAHDALLVPLVEQMMRAANRQMNTLNAIAVSAGPGSFTGLRIGMAAAKGFALALGIPLLAVPTFDAMAWRAAARITRKDECVYFAPVFDARRDDVYFASYAIEHDRVRTLHPAAALHVDDAASRMEDGSLLSGDGSTKLAKAATKTCIIIPEREQMCHAEAVAFLGSEMLERGEIADLARCEPIYLRDFHTTSPKTGDR